ncbi:chitobiase/beta-hexosaminidase C-terminal domain-containing protein [Butyrivibrio sp. WCD2001]|uniref:chitobiase/beta-hexosaminidase C-terminal domain-containing protein n=1 Tax=Butyrivibrio sp. WCD2001 TaxID=1280681 RepID=UPI000419C087|nr:chitobiase/beta-hexosaminidase C-terminal domain-containing protein [Butyrivibrio sp. WCD2001]
MKCPNCGNKIPEGNLYCGICGKEINFVPEFDPEIENKINESLSGVADDLKDESIFYTKKIPGMIANKTELKPYVIPAITGIGIIVGFIIIILFSFGGKNTSLSYEEQAETYYVEGKLSDAIITIDKAIESLSEDDSEYSIKKSELMFQKYGYEKEAGLIEDSIVTLKALTDSSIFDDETVETATKQLIGYYEEQQDYDSIVEVVNNTKNAGIKNEYSEYIPVTPVISPDGGDFDEAVNVRITDTAEGDIYYTVNGDDPDEKSIHYDDELILEEEGDYHIRAVFINKYGIKSDVVKSFFHLESIGPAEPVIMEDSGDYSQATMIVAVCDPGCRILYTSDGSDPTENSTEYFTPISMPIGSSTFKFITIDDEGKMSEIVEKNYHLTYTTMVSVDQAKQSIISILVKLDILLDSAGKVRGEEGYYDYVYDGEIEITGSGEYYKFVETHVYNDGHTNETGLLYAVNTHDGKVNRLGYDSSGKYTLITISNR